MHKGLYFEGQLDILYPEWKKYQLPWHGFVFHVYITKQQQTIRIVHDEIIWPGDNGIMLSDRVFKDNNPQEQLHIQYEAPGLYFFTPTMVHIDIPNSSFIELGSSLLSRPLHKVTHLKTTMNKSNVALAYTPMEMGMTSAIVLFLLLICMMVKVIFERKEKERKKNLSFRHSNNISEEEEDILGIPSSILDDEIQALIPTTSLQVEPTGEEDSEKWRQFFDQHVYNKTSGDKENNDAMGEEMMNDYFNEDIRI